MSSSVQLSASDRGGKWSPRRQVEPVVASGRAAPSGPDPLILSGVRARLGATAPCPPGRHPGGRASPVGVDEPCVGGCPLLASARPTSPGKCRYEWPSSDDRTPTRPLRSAAPGPWPGSGSRSPSRSRSGCSSRWPRPRPPLALLAVFLGLVAAESFNVDFEFRKQSFSWSPSELAFVMALVAVGAAWTAVAWAFAVGVVVPGPGLSRAPKAVFNVAIVVLEVCAAVASCGCCPAGDISEPGTWLAYLARRAGAPASWGRSSSPRRSPPRRATPGGRCGRRCSCPVLLVGPVAVLVGLAVLLLVSVTPWAWLLIAPLLVALALLYRRFAAVTREGHSVERVYDFARRVEQVSPDEDGTRQIVEAVRELLNADRVALWLPPVPRRGAPAGRRRRERRGLVRRPGRPRRRLPPPRGGVAADGPVRVSLARADDEEAAALTRRGVSDLLGAAGHDRGRRARATSRSATGAATSSPSPTATARPWTRCSPTSTPPSGTSSCSPRSATTPTTTG